MANSQMTGAGYDRPYGDPKLSRSVVMAPSGMVATSHTLAAQAGVEVLKRGGNAIDAAVTRCWVGQTVLALATEENSRTGVREITGS